MEQITILGRTFQLHCEESDREMLANAGRNVDRMLQQIRRNDPNLTAEMAAFLACIQLSYDQLNNSLQDNENSVQLASIQAKLEDLNKLLSTVPDVSVVAPPPPGEAPMPVHQVVKPSRFSVSAKTAAAASAGASGAAAGTGAAAASAKPAAGVSGAAQPVGAAASTAAAQPASAAARASAASAAPAASTAAQPAPAAFTAPAASAPAASVSAVDGVNIPVVKPSESGELF